MSLLACVPAPNFIVLGAAPARAIVADGTPLAIATSGVISLVHPSTGARADVHDICVAMLKQFSEDRSWTVGEVARAFARAYAPAVDAASELRVLLAGVGPSDDLAAAFEVVLGGGRRPRVARMLDPYLAGHSLDELPSAHPLRETIASATTLLKNPPARKVARLVRKLLAEAGAEPDIGAVIVTRDGVVRVES